VDGERLKVAAGDAELRAERWRGPANGPTAILLHPGVADRRCWSEVGPRLAARLTAVSYDRRGFGETPPAQAPLSPVDDLVAVLDAVAATPAWLVGSSAGGRLALDAALAGPSQVAGLVLLAPGVGGAPPPVDVDPATERLDGRSDAALAASDLESANRWTTWLWLDGPEQAEGRVSGPARELAMEMSGTALRQRRPELELPPPVDAWGRLGEIAVPAVVACGDLDVPFLRRRSRELARRLPRGRYVELTGTAHAPNLERPEAVAELILGALSQG